jgi:hypothetical protein
MLPYDEFGNMEVQTKVREGYRLPVLPTCPSPFHNLLLRCWDKQWRRRPSFTEIKNEIVLFASEAKQYSPPLRDIGKTLETWTPQDAENQRAETERWQLEQARFFEQQEIQLQQVVC